MPARRCLRASGTSTAAIPPKPAPPRHVVPGLRAGLLSRRGESSSGRSLPSPPAGCCPPPRPRCADCHTLPTCSSHWSYWHSSGSPPRFRNGCRPTNTTASWRAPTALAMSPATLIRAARPGRGRCSTFSTCSSARSNRASAVPARSVLPWLPPACCSATGSCDCCSRTSAAPQPVASRHCIQSCSPCRSRSSYASRYPTPSGRSPFSPCGRAGSHC